MDWHTRHLDSRSFGDRIADSVAAFIGSWRFVIIQSVLMVIWVAGNIYLLFHFDPFPFVFLNLFMSAEAAYSTPLIMMSQNRQSDRYRHQAETDYRTDAEAKEDIEVLMR